MVRAFVATGKALCPRLLRPYTLLCCLSALLAFFSTCACQWTQVSQGTSRCARVLNNNRYSHAQTMLVLLWYDFFYFFFKANLRSLVVPYLIDRMWSAGVHTCARVS